MSSPSFRPRTFSSLLQIGKTCSFSPHNSSNLFYALYIYIYIYILILIPSPQIWLPFTCLRRPQTTHIPRPLSTTPTLPSPTPFPSLWEIFFSPFPMARTPFTSLGAPFLSSSLREDAYLTFPPTVHFLQWNFRRFCINYEISYSSVTRLPIFYFCLASRADAGQSLLSYFFSLSLLLRHLSLT